MAAPPLFNPLDPGYLANPFPHLAEMRAGDPIHATPFNIWILFRHADVNRLLRDPTLSVDDNNVLARDEARMAAFEEALDGELIERAGMLGTDPPDHTRLRRLVSKAFTPSAIEALRPMVRARVAAMLDTISSAEAPDVVADLAFPLPFDVIVDMLGMPESDRDQVTKWSGAMVKTLDPLISEQEVFEAVAGRRAMNALVDDVIAYKRKRPADDLLTALIAAEEDGDRLTSIELRDQVVLLFIAGHETTVNLIGTGIYELLRRPDQLALLRHDPSLDGVAVDELLRYVSPVQFSRRITLAEVDFDGVTIPAGRFVMASLASANHDPDRWGDTADDLDLGRVGAGQHLSFGSGAHYCLGAALAKLEAQEAIGAFIRRFPDAAIAGTPTWNGRINLRGLATLEVTV